MEESLREWIDKSIKNNLDYIKEILKDNSDIIYREFTACNIKCALIYIDGMADKVLLNDFILKPLMRRREIVLNDVDDLKDRLMAISDLSDQDNLHKMIIAMLSGDTMMLVDGYQSGFVIATRAWPNRGVSEPSGETVIRGSREGFTETIRFNTALVRRRIRDPKFRVKPMTLGVRSKSDVAIMYIDDIVNPGVLKATIEELQKIKLDAILDSGYIQSYLERNTLSPFPQVQSTERPDVVAAALYEGRVAIIVDNSPFAIIVPATLVNLFQSPDDYYQRSIYGSITRFIRVIAVLLSVLLPAFYIAVTSFSPSIIPSKLAYSIAAAREGVPFPAFIEVVIMEVAMAILMEAVVRLPKPIGSTIGIVGGLIIGQAAVSAGIVSPIMVIIVGVTAVTSFITPSYEITFGLRIIRFLLIALSTCLGLYGITIGILIILIHLVKLKSFTLSYLSPVVNSNLSDQKDVFVRLDWKYFWKRPKYMKTQDKIRQK
ncbi:spore germination protein [uncultured Clostridium sp.]|uniref:spore germination protein n=1 Tax=uncultured Clostridium sp. TaxID=59620 RepID=UPI0025FB82C8|nr:spore germination protein [uncultured Clostridium sp.]